MSMGKSWNKLGRKGHRHERSQPAARRHLGFLEHHSDYAKRAKDFHEKQNELQHLRLLASLRNPDEFHSDMVHTKALDGRLWIDPKKKISKEKLKIHRDRDHKRIIMDLQHQRKKLKRELNSFHCIDALNLNKYKKQKKMEIVESSNPSNSNSLLTVQNEEEKRSDHIIYVDSNEERVNFDASLYFKTPKELLDQKHNRLKTSQLTSKRIKMKLKFATKLKNRTLFKYWQIQARIKKVENMKKYHSHLTMKRKIHSGDSFMVHRKRNVETGKVIKKSYKWKKERKR